MKLVAALTACVCGIMGYGAIARPVPKISVFERHVVEMARQRGVSVDEAVKAVRKWGVEGADLWFSDEEKPGNERMLAGGLKAATLIVFMDLAHTNDTARTEAAIAYAKSVGSPRLMLVPGFVRKGEDHEAAWMRMEPNLADFVRRAGRAGLTVDIEDFDASDILIGSQEDLRRTFAAFPELGHVLDTGNYLFWTNDVLQAQREFASRIRHVHVKDRAKDDMARSVAAGTGIIPVKKILSGLQSANYNGWLTVECFGSTNMWDDVRRSAESIADILHDAEGDCPSGDVSKFDERIAADRSQVDVEGLEWVDGASLPLESRGFANTPSPYARMPADLLPSCPEGVRAMSAQSTGHYFLFETDSNKLAVEWVLREKSGRDPFIPPQGMYGVDIYDTVDGKWRFVRNGRLSALDNPTNRVSVAMPGKGLRPVLVYLPTRGIVTSARIGLRAKAKLAPHRHASGIVRPVVHYGTSIVHGGCASRPGLCFTSIAGRTVDAPYVNLGFSGCARLEPVMADAMARIDASLYLVDPAWNCSPEVIRERLEVFLRKLHAARPDVPILLCEGIEPAGTRLKVNTAIKEIYDRLMAEGSRLAARLHYLPAEGLIPTDGESTHDYVHPNDYGSVHMGKAFARAISEILQDVSERKK